MREDIKQLRTLVSEAERILEGVRARLMSAIVACRHEWLAPSYDPIVQEAYHIEGDPPGTMGCAHQFPMDVPRQEIKRWRRDCVRCGEAQYTSATTKEVRETPSWPGERR